MLEARQSAMSLRKARIKKEQERYSLNTFTLMSHQKVPKDAPLFKECLDFCPKLTNDELSIY